MSKNIVLIGLMGSGKSTVGKILAEKLNMNFIDTDSLIEEYCQNTICDIFNTNGESYFRDIESKIISEVSKNTAQVISTGGGIVEREENINKLKKSGIIVYLEASAQELFNRIKHETNRPLLQNENPLATLENLLIKRGKYYNKANFKVNVINKKAEVIADEIIQGYKNYE